MQNKKMMYLCIDFELQNKHVKFLKFKRNEKSIFIFCGSYGFRHLALLKQLKLLLLLILQLLLLILLLLTQLL